MSADGSITLESLLVLPVVGLLLLALTGMLGVAADQLGATRAAGAAARTVAVSGDQGEAVAAARVIAPSSEVHISVVRRVATVRVRVAGAVLGVRYAVDATAAAPLEPDVR